MPCRARIFEIRSQSRDMHSNVIILSQPLGPRRTAALVHRATFTSNTREMLLRPVPESGTIRTAFQNYPRNQSPDLSSLSLVYLYDI